MMAMMIMTMVVMAGKQTVDMRKDIRAHGQADMQIGRQAGRRTGRHTETHRQTSRQLSYVCLYAVQADRRAVGRQPVMPSAGQPTGRRQADRAGREHACRQAHRQAGVHCLHDCGCVCVYVFQAGRRNGRRAGVRKEVQQRD